MMTGLSIDALLSALPALAFWAPVLWWVPLFGGRHLPAPARLALALLLSGLGPPSDVSGPEALVGILCMGFGGLLVGLLLRLPFDLLRGVGEAAAASQGIPASWAGLSPDGDRGAALALALELSLLAAAGPFGLDHHALRLAASVRVPLQEACGAFGAPHTLALLPKVESMGPSPLVLGTWIFASLLALALPFLLAAWLLDLALGSIGRLLPQLPVFFLAQPLKALLVMLLLAAGAPSLIEAGVLAMDEVGAMIERAQAQTPLRVPRPPVRRGGVP